MSSSSLEFSEELLAPEPGWRVEAEGFTTHRSANDMFVPASATDGRLALRCYVREADGRAVGKAWFGPRSLGPPGHAHGGSSISVMDHVLGRAVWLAGHPCFTGRLEHDYRAMIPLGSVALVEGWIEKVEGRKVFARGTLHLGDGTLAGETAGLFVRMPMEAQNAIRERDGYEAT